MGVLMVVIFIIGIRSVYEIKLGKAIIIGILPGLVISIIVVAISVRIQPALIHDQH